MGQLNSKWKEEQLTHLWNSQVFVKRTSASTLPGFLDSGAPPTAYEPDPLSGEKCADASNPRNVRSFGPAMTVRGIYPPKLPDP